MIDLHSTIVSALKTIGLPVHYEMILHSGMETPCISYMELTNFVQDQSDVSDISVIQFQVKIWGTSIATLQSYVPLIDKAMRDINFKRTSAAELYDNNSSMIQKVFTYEKLAAEVYTNT